MEIKTYSYRFAEEILQNKKYSPFYEEILEICKSTPIPIFEGKSKKQNKLNVVQQILNTYLRLKFKEKGWEDEPFATPEINEDSLRSDFKKTFLCSDGKELTIQVEVEFGNIASSYRNYFKFQLSFSYDMTDICILILPTYELSVRIDSGVASFEKTVREIPSGKLSITVPIMVIGLDSSDQSFDWDVKNGFDNFIKTKGLDIKKEEYLPILKGAKKQYRTLQEEFILSYINSFK